MFQLQSIKYVIYNIKNKRLSGFNYTYETLAYSSNLTGEC